MPKCDEASRVMMPCREIYSSAVAAITNQDAVYRVTDLPLSSFVTLSHYAFNSEAFAVTGFLSRDCRVAENLHLLGKD
jgi:hypothetical protein